MVRPITPADLPRLALYDRPLTGMERPSILMHISRCASPAAPGWRRTWAARSSGFVLGREGRMATSLGPVVADREAIAPGLIASAAAAAPGPFIIDVPEAHQAVRAWLAGAGRDLARAATCA